MRTLDITLNNTTFKSENIMFLPNEKYFTISSKTSFPTTPLLTISFENYDEKSRPFRNEDLNKKFSIDTSFICFEYKKEKPANDIIFQVSIY